MTEIEYKDLDFEKYKNIPICFRPIPSNPLYQMYLKTPHRQADEEWEKEFEWKYFLLRKYLKTQCINYFSISVAALFIFILSLIFFDNFKRIAMGGMLISFILAGCFVFFVIGIAYGSTYARMYKYHRRYIWREQTKLSYRMEKYFTETYF